jgi:hypothetical protein
MYTTPPRDAIFVSFQEIGSKHPYINPFAQKRCQREDEPFCKSLHSPKCRTTVGKGYEQGRPIGEKSPKLVTLEVPN